MMIKIAGTALVAILSAAVATAATAAPAVTLTSPGAIFGSSLYTLGFSFEVGSPQTIDQLGVWDADGAPLPVDAQVGLWNDSGALLTSVTVPASGGTLVDGFRYADITPFALTPGQVYVVGAFLGDDGSATSFNTNQGGSGSFNPLITPLFDRFSHFNSAFSFPTDSDGFAGGAWLGANFNLVSAIPEPATWVTLLLGLAALGVAMRRTRRRDGPVSAAA